MMMLKPLCAAIGAAALLAACEPVATNQGPTGDDPLAGSWRVLSIAGVKVDDPNATSMTFAGLSTVTGNFGCGQFQANYTYDRNVVFITNLSGGGVGCTGAAERQNRHGMRALTMPMTVVADTQSAILSGREGQAFALGR